MGSSACYQQGYQPVIWSVCNTCYSSYKAGIKTNSLGAADKLDPWAGLYWELLNSTKALGVPTDE